MRSPFLARALTLLTASEERPGALDELRRAIDALAELEPDAAVREMSGLLGLEIVLRDRGLPLADRLGAAILRSPASPSLLAEIEARARRARAAAAKHLGSEPPRPAAPTSTAIVRGTIRAGALRPSDVERRRARA